MLHTYAEELVREGFVIVPPHIHNIPVIRIEDAMEAGERLIKFWSQLECQKSLCREGEDSPDFGLIDTRNVPGKDLKFFLHVAFDLQEMISKVPDLAHALLPYRNDIDKLLQLHGQLNHFNMKLFSEISRLLPEMAEQHNIVAEFEDSFTKSIPGGNTVLRGLLYPTMPKQTGAMPHFDIDFMANHLGDKGGSLMAHQSLDSEKCEDVSPPHGSILVFPGLKALVVSKGKLTPLYHSATADYGRDRQAFVQFNHIICPQVQPGDGKKFDHVFKGVGILNPDEWYEEFFGR